MSYHTRLSVVSGTNRQINVLAIVLFFWIGACSSASNGVSDVTGGASGGAGGMVGSGGMDGVATGGTTGIGGTTGAGGLVGTGGTGAGSSGTMACHVVSATGTGGGDAGPVGGAGGGMSGSAGVGGASLYDGGTAALEGTYHCTAGRYMSNSCFSLSEWDIVVEGNEARFPLPLNGLYDRAEAVCNGLWMGEQLDCCSVWIRNGRYCDFTFRLRFMSANELILWSGSPEPAVDYSARCER